MNPTGATTSTSPLHQEQFVDAAQQRAAASMGMWVFLISEVMFFGALFTGYGEYRFRYPHDFASAAHQLGVILGAVNTIVLICSSLTMALAVRSAQLGENRPLRQWLAATMALG